MQDKEIAALQKGLATKLELIKKPNIFLAKKANKWLEDASLKPAPQPLFDCYWNEGEVCILFADTNVGKSLLATQIAQQIAENEVVLYLDFELNDKQFEARYSNNFQNHFKFHDNFIRAEIDPDQADYREVGFETMEQFIAASLKDLITTHDAKVVVIDNITYLKHDNEKSKEALPLMKELKALKNEFSLSILALAHTPKRTIYQPISKNDLSGSKMLMNICDSSFAIGDSAKDKNLRYLKQIKTRNAGFTYDTDNVAVYEIQKPDNFTMFTFVHTDHEHEHLKHYTKEDKELLINKSKELYKNRVSQREISRKLGIALSTVNNYIHSSSCSSETDKQFEQK